MEEKITIEKQKRTNTEYIPEISPFLPSNRWEGVLCDLDIQPSWDNDLTLQFKDKSNIMEYKINIPDSWIFKRASKILGQEKHKQEVSKSDVRIEYILDKEIVHGAMPKNKLDSKIAFLDVPIELSQDILDSGRGLTDPNQMQKYLEKENQMLKDMVDKIVNSGANVVFCRKGINDIAQHFLAMYNIIAVRRIRTVDMEQFSKLTHGTIVTSIDDLSASDLGKASYLEEIKDIIGDYSIHLRI